ncbi:MAG: hypothetical protein Q9181_004162 [Wetmoreana brouardii]
MAPQTSIPVAANVLGTIGTVFWCIQLIPQIWYNWKQKKTDGLPGLMMFVWAISAVPFGVYAIVQHETNADNSTTQNFNIPIQIQPQMFCYPLLDRRHCIAESSSSAWPAWKAASLATVIGAVFGGLQALLVLTLRGPYSRGVEWPMTLVGVLSAVLLAGGLIPPYFEIAKRHGRVVGINFVFLSIDWLGAFFSLMALVAQHTFDVLGGVQYIVCLLLEVGIFTSHLLFLLRTRTLRHRAKDSQVPFDEMPEARKFVYPRPETTTAASTTNEAEKGQVRNGAAENERSGEAIEVEGGRQSELGSERERRRRRSSTPGVSKWPSRQ